MISVANAVPVLLFVLTLNNGGVYVAGTIGDTPDMDMDRPHCKSHDFINTELDRCFHRQGLPAIKIPWDPEFLSSINNFVTSIEEDMCGTQFLRRVKEAYHCFYNSCRDCYVEFFTDPANSVENRLFVQDLALYATDPDMLGDALRGVCELEEEDWSCLDGDKGSRLLLCWLGELQAMISKLRKDLFNKRSPVKTFKPALCEMFSGFQRCTTDRLQGCPQKTVSMAARVVNLLTPLGCHIHGTTGMKRDGERQAESAHIHDDL